MQDAQLHIAFAKGSAPYLVPAFAVNKVVEIGPITALPRLPGYVLGISQHRGRIITVMDFEALMLSEPQKVPPPTSECWMLVLDNGLRHIGLLVDRVDGTQQITTEINRPGPAVGIGLVEHQNRVFRHLDVGELTKQIETRTPRNLE